MAVPSLISLLNDKKDGVRLATLCSITSLADHGESVVVHYPDIANTVIKSSFERKSERPSH
jgi:hypothetical protein